MALKDDIALLRRLDFFNAFSDDALRMMLFAAERRTIAAGEKLFSKGSPAPGGFVVTSGAIAMIDEPDGFELDLVGPGTLIGELALLAASERSVHAIAREDSTLISLPRSLMHRLLKEYPDTAQYLRDQLLERSIALRDALQNFLDRSPSNEL